MLNVGLTSIGLLWAFSPPVSADTVLVRDGEPCATVVVGEDASQQAREAAAELQEYVRRMTGAELPVAERVASGGANVLVGRSAASDLTNRLGLRIPSGVTSHQREPSCCVRKKPVALKLFLFQPPKRSS